MHQHLALIDHRIDHHHFRIKLFIKLIVLVAIILPIVRGFLIFSQ